MFGERYLAVNFPGSVKILLLHVKLADNVEIFEMIFPVIGNGSWGDTFPPFGKAGRDPVGALLSQDPVRDCVKILASAAFTTWVVSLEYRLRQDWRLFR